MAIRKTTKGKNANYRPTKSGAGMTAKGVKAYRRANPGSKLKTAVTGKVKAGSKSAKSPIIIPCASYSSSWPSNCSSADAEDKTGVKKEITIRPIKNSDFVERFSDMRGTQLNATLHSN